MKVKFITFGCSRNQADTELMKGLCKHEVVDSGQDITIINTCFVKEETERKILRLIHSIKGKAVITGCLAQARPGLIEAFPQHSFLGVGAIERINEAIEGQVVDLSNGSPDFCQERVPTNPLISIIPISEGCLGACSYCCTKQARGNLKSRSINNILKQVRIDLAKGAKEFWLTSQDTGCYGFDINTNLAELLNDITSLEGEFRVRVGMMNPQHALKVPNLKRAFNNKVYKFIHVPIQSGSDKVLRDMNRGYTVKDFKKLIKEFEGFTISTDIICAYPTESEIEWQETIKLINEIKPDIINISRFFARPGTKACELKQLPSRISKERSRELTRLHRTFNNNQSLIGQELRVLVNEEGRGRTDSYQPVIIKAPLGSFNKVKVVAINRYLLLAKNI